MFPDITCDDIFRVETRRLWLRWPRAADAAAVAAFAGLADVAEMTASIPHPYPAGEAERFVLSTRAANAAGQALILAATLKNKGRSLIGLVSAQVRDAHTIEIGYVVTPSHAGRGYASEAVVAVIDTVFNLTEARKLVADARTINPASRRVLEKCGFAYTSTGGKELAARGGRHEVDFFDLDRHVWARHDQARRLPAMAQQALRRAANRAGGQSQQ